MYRTILVPLDGSQLAERTVPYAAMLARASPARLLLVRAALTYPSPGTRPIKDQTRAVREAEGYLANIAQQLADLTVETAVHYGEADDAIVEEIGSRRVDLVVLSTHGCSGLGSWVYGSVADRVLRRAEVPVLLVPVACASVWPGDRPLRILVPLDGSRIAQEALAPANDLAEILGAAIVLLRVVEPPTSPRVAGSPGRGFDVETELVRAQRYLVAIAADLRRQGRMVLVHVVSGSPLDVITTMTHEGDIDAIATATNGNGGLRRAAMGSVATGMVQRACVPILIVRPAVVRQPAAPGPKREPAGMRLSERELELVQRGLERLLSAPGQEEPAAGELHDLLSRLREED